MNLGTIFTLEEYDEAYDFIIKNNLSIDEILPENGIRRFQIVEKLKPTEEDEIDFLRVMRENECFSFVNRGKLWYDKLTEEQLEELEHWYHKWLDVTETKIIPERPLWLD